MKAIVQDMYGSADVLQLRDIEDPVVGEKDVLVRVHAAGCGPDVWHLMTGLPYFARLAVGFRRPKVGVRGWAWGRTEGSPASAAWEPRVSCRKMSSRSVSSVLRSWMVRPVAWTAASTSPTRVRLGL